MAQPFPYTYYSCSCVDTSTSSFTKTRNSSSQPQHDSDSETEETFDPRAPRSNFSLFPLEHLLYCTECHQIRCRRCITEEVVCWYCPSCLFEVPSSTVRSEGNRCTRSCYNCPECTSFLSISALGEDEGEGPVGPYVLNCPYCMWTSLDVGIKFEKSNNITAQLAKIRNGGQVVKSVKEREERARRGSAHDSDEAKSPVEEKSVDHAPTADEIFGKLNSFYKQQLEDSTETGIYGTTAGDLNYASPSSINRLLNMYATGKRIKAKKPKPMRSAYHVNEGLSVLDPSRDEVALEKMQEGGWEGTTRMEQLGSQEPRNSMAARFTSELRPVATLLRTKRSKRCKSCRTLLSRPEPKVSTTRYKIRVLASTNLPSLTLRSLTSPPTTSTTHPLLALPRETSNLPYTNLKPLSPHQFILTITNPLFDSIRISLATPATTPGRVQNKVTLLCPAFEVGANTDVWDEALNTSASAMAKRRSVMPGTSGAIAEEGGRQPEVGKVWERGRNWTSVVMEVVPGMLSGSTGTSLTAAVEKEAAKEHQGQADFSDDESEDDDGMQEDEDVIEIPIFVRVRYETDPSGAAAEERKESATKESREIEFWSVLGVGRITS